MAHPSDIMKDPAFLRAVQGVELALRHTDTASPYAELYARSALIAWAHGGGCEPAAIEKLARHAAEYDPAKSV